MPKKMVSVRDASIYLDVGIRTLRKQVKDSIDKGEPIGYFQGRKCFVEVDESQIKEDEDDGVDEEPKESEAVLKSKEATKLATENFKRTEQETNAKLIEKGWKTIEDGIKVIEEEKKALSSDRDKLEKEKSDFGKKVLACQQHIEESNNHRAISVEMKKQAEAKYSQAVIMIKEADLKIKLAETQIKSLQDCIIYFDTYIEPILKNLKAVKKAIYGEAEYWQKNEALWKLFQFVTNKIVALEKLLDNVRNATIPDALKVPETDNGQKTPESLQDTTVQLVEDKESE